MIVLDDGTARAVIHPEAGAAVGRYDLIAPDGKVRAIFQTAPLPGRRGPFALGLNLLIPFSNRISGGGFRHEGVFHPLARNGADPYPIHGNAFGLPWTVHEVSASRAVLGLLSDGPGPFRYEAEIDYALADGALTARLSVVNRAATSLPYGVGLHPWLVRTPPTTLKLNADGYWTETADHLPDAHVAAAGDAHFDFTSARSLPESFFNNALTGWDGMARLEWPDRNLGVAIEATPPLTTLILYSPSASADFVCIEPVSHTVDAHNRSGVGVAKPQILQPDETLVAETTFRPYTT